MNLGLVYGVQLDQKVTVVSEEWNRNIAVPVFSL
jgi:hypothetical protein